MLNYELIEYPLRQFTITNHLMGNGCFVFTRPPVPIRVALLHQNLPIRVINHPQRTYNISIFFQQVKCKLGSGDRITGMLLLFFQCHQLQNIRLYTHFFNRRLTIYLLCYQFSIITLYLSIRNHQACIKTLIHAVEAKEVFENRCRCILVQLLYTIV